MIKKFYRYKFVLIATLAFGATLANAQSLKISAKFDSAIIKIGDQVKLRVEVDQPKNAKVVFPTFKDSVASKIELVQALPADTSKTGENLHIVRNYLVTCFDSGYHTVPSIPFPFQMGGTKDTMSSLPFSLTVLTVPVDTAKEIKDIKPVMNTPFSILEIWQYILIGLGVILLAVLIWFIIKKMKKEPIFASRKVLEPAHIVALRELDALRAEKLWQQSKEKQYYTKLTEIVRAYIERRYEVNALEMTSDEILDALKKVNLEEPALIELLRRMFSTADLVKFAKALPLPDENEIHLLNSYQFVNNTKLASVSNITEPDEANTTTNN